MFSWYKYLIVGLVFSRLGFWSGNLFLIAPFPDLCLLVPYCNLSNFNRIVNTKTRIIQIEPNRTSILNMEPNLLYILKYTDAACFHGAPL